jgi:poly(hydroxyalkanoate) depolymerase family esterase
LPRTFGKSWKPREHFYLLEVSMAANRRRLVSALVLLSLVFGAGLAFAAGSPAPKALPKAEDMVIDPVNYYGQVVQGYYNYDCFVSKDLTRPAKFYIPAGSVYNQPTVFVMVPDGYDTYQFLEASGWKDIADFSKLYIVMMEPGAKGWGDEASEAKYIDALREDVSYRPFFCTFSSNFYAAAYGEKETAILTYDSAKSPANWAGVAFVGTSGMSAKLAADMQQTPSKVPGVAMSQVLQPVWIVANEKSADVARMIDYFRAADHSVLNPAPTAYADEVYEPRKGGTIDNEWCAKVIFSRKSWKDCLGKDFAGSVYNNLLQGTYRYPGDSNGALRQNDSIYLRGFRKVSAMLPGGFKADGSDLYNREWFVYVPRNLDITKPAPLVFVFHGAGGSGDEIADRSGWSAVAEEKGLILVCPTGSHINSVRKVSDMTTSELFRAMWNAEDAATETRPNDLLFVRYLYDWMKQNYRIDESRVYASGQSSGGMMTWACATYLPELFAAAAPISANGTMTALPDGTGKTVVPIIGFIGELDTSFKGGFSGAEAKATINYWSARNKTVENWDSYTYMDGGKKCSYKSDLFTNYVYRNKAGVPVLRAVEVATKTHAILPSECFIAWDECLSHFSRDKKTGELYYDGQLVK